MNIQTSPMREIPGHRRLAMVAGCLFFAASGIAGAASVTPQQGQSPEQTAGWAKRSVPIWRRIDGHGLAAFAHPTGPAGFTLS